MAGRFDIATGKHPPEDPNKAVLENPTNQEISDIVIKKLSPKNGDVFFISSPKFDHKTNPNDAEALRRALAATMKNLHLTCGLIVSTYELDIKKEALGDVVRIEFVPEEHPGLAEEGSDEEKLISQAILKDNRPITDTPEGFNQALSGMR